MADLRHRMVLDLEPTVEGVIDALVGLSTRWVDKHGDHVGRVASLWGYVLSFVELEKAGVPWDDSEFRNAVEGAAECDVYFLANVDFRDPQTPWIKRWFWNRFTRRDYEARLDSIVPKSQSAKDA